MDRNRDSRPQHFEDLSNPETSHKVDLDQTGESQFIDWRNINNLFSDAGIKLEKGQKNMDALELQQALSSDRLKLVVDKVEVNGRRISVQLKASFGSILYIGLVSSFYTAYFRYKKELVRIKSKPKLGK